MTRPSDRKVDGVMNRGPGCNMGLVGSLLPLRTALSKIVVCSDQSVIHDNIRYPTEMGESVEESVKCTALLSLDKISAVYWSKDCADSVEQIYETVKDEARELSKLLTIALGRAEKGDGAIAVCLLEYARELVRGQPYRDSIADRARAYLLNAIQERGLKIDSARLQKLAKMFLAVRETMESSGNLSGRELLGLIRDYVNGPLYRRITDNFSTLNKMENLQWCPLPKRNEEVECCLLQMWLASSDESQWTYEARKDAEEDCSKVSRAVSYHMEKQGRRITIFLTTDKELREKLADKVRARFGVIIASPKELTEWLLMRQNAKSRQRYALKT